MISVSRTLLPDISEYNKYLKRIWKSNWLTNNGELVQELERKLQKYFGVKHVICVSSGTSAILIVLRAMGIRDEIYISPHSFISTVSAPLWDGITVRFVDEGEKYGKPALVTHIYGIPHIIPDKNAIYDASHAFAVKINGRSILSFGKASVISFHAVKIFQTAEGGAIVTNDDEIADKSRWMRNYGFKTKYSFYGAGINAKMSEFHAAMGLCSLKLVKRIVKKYVKLIKRYNEALGYHHEGVTYYPIWYQSEKQVLKAIEEFEKHDIYPRRYFYPPLNRVFRGKSCPIAEDRMSRVLCLPLYYDLTQKDQDKVIRIANETLR